MKHAFLLKWLGICLLSFPLSLVAQESTMVSGRVMDMESEEPLVGGKYNPTEIIGGHEDQRRR